MPLPRKQAVQTESAIDQPDLFCVSELIPNTYPIKDLLKGIHAHFNGVSWWLPSAKMNTLLEALAVSPSVWHRDFTDGFAQALRGNDSIEPGTLTVTDGYSAGVFAGRNWSRLRHEREVQQNH